MRRAWAEGASCEPPFRTVSNVARAFGEPHAAARESDELERALALSRETHRMETQADELLHARTGGVERDDRGSRHMARESDDFERALALSREVQRVEAREAEELALALRLSEEASKEAAARRDPKLREAVHPVAMASHLAAPATAGRQIDALASGLDHTADSRDQEDDSSSQEKGFDREMKMAIWASMEHMGSTGSSAAGASDHVGIYHAQSVIASADAALPAEPSHAALELVADGGGDSAQQPNRQGEIGFEWCTDSSVLFGDIAVEEDWEIVEWEP